MPIDRTPWNALADDDGTDLIGSMWNKAAVKNVVLDPVDNAITARVDNPLTNTDTGVKNAWDPGAYGQHSMIVWYGSGDLTLNGMAGGVAGQRVTIRNIGSGPVIYIAYNNGSAAAGARFQNYVTSGPTPIAPLGSATYVYEAAQGLWSLVAHEQGAWITPPFNAANYAAATGTWVVDAGDISTNAWRLSGRTVTAILAFGSTSNPAGNGQLRVVIPFGWRSAKLAITYGQITDNVAIPYSVAYLMVVPSYDPTLVIAQNLANSALQTSTNNTGLYGTISFEIT